MVLPSLTLYQPTDESVPLILAVGENALRVLTTAEGRLLNCVQLPHTPIAPGCFDVGCSISGGSIDTIDGVASAAACQELCAPRRVRSGLT